MTAKEGMLEEAVCGALKQNKLFHYGAVESVLSNNDNFSTLHLLQCLVILFCRKHIPFPALVEFRVAVC